MRRVTRRWTTKSGQVRERVYTYGVKKSPVLMDKKGRIRKQAYNDFVQSIRNNPNTSEAAKRSLINKLDAYLEQQKDKRKKVTVSGFTAHTENDAISRFFTAAGFSPEEFAEQAEIDVEELLNPENWVNGEFIIDANEKIKFSWTYTGNFWKRVER